MIGGSFKLKFASLRKHAYSSILKMLPPINGKFQIKNSYIFIFLLKTWIMGTRRGSSNEYQQSMLFEQKIRKLMYTHVNLGFTI